VPIGADPEEDHIEARRELDVRRAERMDLLLGHGDSVEERLAREPLVRVGVIRWNVTLVAPPDVPGPPVEVVLGEALVHGPDFGPSRQGDAKRLGLNGPVGNPGGCMPG